MRFRIVAVIALLLCSFQVSAQSPAPVAEGPPLDTVVIAGRFAGPGLWKVRRGDHVMWVFGTLGPLPKRMQWDSLQVERRIGQSQEVLLSPRVSFDAGVGYVRGLLLLPSFLKARRNPDGKTLSQVVPPAMYARWVVLKKRYIGGDRGIEQRRPLFAALELYGKAISRSGMTENAGIDDTVRKMARRKRVPATAPTVTVKVSNPKAALKEFSRITLDDVECFSRTMERIETDLGLMRTRANAWATGDIATLRRIRARQTQWSACTAAIGNSALGARLGIGDLEQRMERAWLDAAEKALGRNQVTFAMLPMSQVLAEDGYLAKLAARGYTIEAP
jgi:hypothetical protein